MRICELRDWHTCLNSIHERLDYSHFKKLAQEAEEEPPDFALVLFLETYRDIAEGMLRIVVSLPQQLAVSSELERFATEVAGLLPDPASGHESDSVAEAYRHFCNEQALLHRGLPAAVETFKAYAESRCNLWREPLDVLREAQRMHAEPDVALRLVGEVGCLCLRGLEDVENLMPHVGRLSRQGALADWIDAIDGTVGYIADDLHEYPLGEVELARDQWRAPDDEQRIEYKKAKLVRLGATEPEIQALLLPLFAPPSHDLPAEMRALISAGPKVVHGLIAIAGDCDSQLHGSVSGGEAAIRAVQLLGELRAEEAVPTLLKILENSEWITIIHDRTLQALQDQMPDLAFDRAQELYDRTIDTELKCDLAGILANGGRGKPGVFERLIGHFRREKAERDLMAGYLADLGDPRALPDLHEALRRANDAISIAGFEEAIVQLGGELSAPEKEKLRRLRAQTWEGEHSAESPPSVSLGERAPVRANKIGRNEPCPCGSGKKYKKCCGG